jgi:hypothetical protein
MSVEEQMNAIREAITEDLNKNKDIIFNSLVEEAPINSIPESLFVNYFLPCFIGRVDNPNWVMEWISIAGTPTSEINVVKDGTQEFLYRVPGILSTKTLFNNNSLALSDVFTRYDQLTSNMPSQGLNFLMGALNNINKNLLSDYDNDSVKKSWLHILRRYSLIEDYYHEDSPDSNSNISDYLEI